MRNSKTSYRNESSPPNNCVMLNVVDECSTKCSLITSAKIKSFQNRKERLISAFPLLAAFHGVKEVV